MSRSIQLPLLALREYQKGLWNYMLAEEKGLRGLAIWPRRNGKDLVAINIIVAKALQRVGLYLYIAPYATQVRTIIWDGVDGSGKRFLDYIPPELVARKLDNQMKIWLKNGSIIQLVGSDNPDAIVGSNPLGICYTEFSLHKDAIWGYMRPILSENGGWAMFNGTPRGLNHFYALYEMARQNPAWFCEKLTRDDTGYPSLDSIEAERQAGMPESLIQQEYYTSFTASSEETLIPLDIIQDTFDTVLTEADFNFAPRIIGVDPAYAEKGDLAVICRRQGRMVYELEVHQGKDPMALASRVAMIINEWRPHCVNIDGGRGEAIWSRLYQLGYQDRVHLVHFGGKTYDELCVMKRDEMWNRAKNFIANPLRPKLPHDENLVRDLTAPMYTLDERGRMLVESKRSLKKRGFRSTDRADAFLLTLAEDYSETDFDVAQDNLRDYGMSEDEYLRAEHLITGTQSRAYNPLAYLVNKRNGLYHINR